MVDKELDDDGEINASETRSIAQCNSLLPLDMSKVRKSSEQSSDSESNHSSILQKSTAITTTQSIRSTAIKRKLKIDSSSSTSNARKIANISNGFDHNSQSYLQSSSSTLPATTFGVGEEEDEDEDEESDIITREDGKSEIDPERLKAFNVSPY